MPHHRLQLCKEHYLAWFIEHTDHTIRRYKMFDRSAHILVAVSGGKDSLSLWDVLWRLGYQADGMYINLGIQSEDDYSNRSQQFATDFARQRDLKLQVVDVAHDYGKAIPEVAITTSSSPPTIWMMKWRSSSATPSLGMPTCSAARRPSWKPAPVSCARLNRSAVSMNARRWLMPYYNRSPTSKRNVPILWAASN
jgi:tRNA(Ile)-lysidine synthase TilS/MesJ